MKIFSTIALLSALLLAHSFTADAAVVNHQASLYKYSKNIQPIIKIATGNAKGMKYEVKNSNKETVLKGEVKSTEDIIIPSFKLPAGTYAFVVNGKEVKTFIIE